MVNDNDDDNDNDDSDDDVHGSREVFLQFFETLQRMWLVLIDAQLPFRLKDIFLPAAGLMTLIIKSLVLVSSTVWANDSLS